ncbi:unnamed protein product [Lactuca saligna]|uniref:Uncharacterized protein n=1 Tax=Lactuca saligna TaxID=75948 RepID=A0AA36E2D7_LACSI|nr:unnamed protein product [Lactuca saligna]
MDEFIAQLDSTARIPPQEVFTPTITPSDRDLDESQASQSSYHTTIETSQPIHVEGTILDEGTSFAYSSFEAGSLSTLGSSSPPQPKHDAASECLTSFSAQEDVDPAPRGKGISIGAGGYGVKSHLSLSSRKRLLNLGALTVGYFDLNNKLISEFGDKFKILVNEYHEAEASQSASAQATQDSQDAPKHVSTTRIVDHFEKEPAQADPRLGVRDICTLVEHQIMVNNYILEVSAKEFTGMVVEIINKCLWAGAKGSSDVMFADNP